MSAFRLLIHKHGRCRIFKHLSTSLLTGIGQTLLCIVNNQLLDQRLQEINSDYEAKRYKNITLQHLEIIEARHNLFNDWLKLRGKLGGQHKVPRLSNSRETIDQLLKLNQ